MECLFTVSTADPEVSTNVHSQIGCVCMLVSLEGYLHAFDLDINMAACVKS